MDITDSRFIGFICNGNIHTLANLRFCIYGNFDVYSAVATFTDTFTH